jgi:hypothetical protein
MTSLAYYAAPFGEESDSYIEKKKRKNKTLKRNSTIKNHVQSMINEIHKSTADDDSSGELDDFNANILPSPYTPNSDKPPETLEDAPVSLESFNNLQNNYSQQYYDQVIPNANNMSESIPVEHKNLLEKLDHIIHLLEENRDEKTGHVTEELVLYSFLGVFIIFIIDSFARAGKYVR